MASTEELLDQLVRLQVLQIRMTLPSQTEAIVELSKTKLGPTRIADLLGTTPGTVKTTIKRANAKPRPIGKKRKEEV